jgi:hypothetical protein
MRGRILIRQHHPGRREGMGHVECAMGNKDRAEAYGTDYAPCCAWMMLKYSHLYFRGTVTLLSK